jgi:RecQ-mediated genome instability protein 1
MEMIARGEEMKGREIIRTVTLDEGRGPGGMDSGTSGGAAGPVAEGDTGHGSSLGPHRLVLQDANGTKVTAVELTPVDGIGIGKTPIGAKMILKNATVARGMILLEPASTTLLGGKIEVLDKEWKEGRKDKLLAQLAQIGANDTT